MYLANGCSIPIGKVIDYSDQERYIAHNEYVVYDESQIRIRYLVQVIFFIVFKKNYFIIDQQKIQRKIRRINEEENQENIKRN